MIKTKRGIVRVKGSRRELAADIICIMLSLEDHIPGFTEACTELVLRMGELEDIDDADS